MDTPTQTAPLPVPPEEPVIPPSQSPAPAPEQKSYLLPLLGILILVLSGGAFVLAKLNTPVRPATEVVQLKPKRVFLTIESPKESVTAVDGEVLVTGKTLPDSTVLMYSDSDDAIVDSNADGSFEGSVVVGAGGGLLRITAVTANGDEVTKTVELHGISGISYLNTPDVLGKSTAPGQVKKAEAAPNDRPLTVTGKPESDKVSGKPTDLSRPGEKPTVSPKPEDTNREVVTFLNKKSSAPKTHKLGTSLLKNLLSPESSGSGKTNPGKLKKMEVADASPAADLKRHALEGVITAIDGGIVTVSHQTQTDRITKVYVNVDTVITAKKGTPAVLAVGQRIAAIGEPVDGGLLATRIHIIPGKALGLRNGQPVASEGAGTATPTPLSTVSATLTPSKTPTGSPSLSPSATPTAVLED